MIDIRLEPYVRERDHKTLTDMLQEDPIQAENVLAATAIDNCPDSVYIALLGGRPVGYLTINGFRWRTHTAIYVKSNVRRKGIGTALLRLADGLFAGNEAVELSAGVCKEDDHNTLQTLYRHGYYRGHGALTMERRGDPLPTGDHAIRFYEDADYPAWHRVYESAF